MFVLQELIKTEKGFSKKSTILGKSVMTLTEKNGEDFFKYKNSKGFNEDTFLVLLTEDDVLFLSKNVFYTITILDTNSPQDISQMEDTQTAENCEDDCHKCSEDCDLSSLVEKQNESYKSLEALEDLLRRAVEESNGVGLKESCGGVKCGQKECLDCKGSNFLEKILKSRGL